MDSVLYNFTIYNKQGKILLYLNLKDDELTDADEVDEEKLRLIFGLLFSLKQFNCKMSNNENNNLYSLTTDKYILHHYETITGYRFVLNTSVVNTNKQKEIYLLLKNVYSNLFINYVIQNPLYKLNSKIKIPKFLIELKKLLTNL